MKEKEKFYLKIDASSEDGESIRSNVESSISCTRQTAIGILVNLLKKDENLKELLIEAILFSNADIIDIQEEKISDTDEEPNKEEDLEL